MWLLAAGIDKWFTMNGHVVYQQHEWLYSLPAALMDMRVIISMNGHEVYQQHEWTWGLSSTWMIMKFISSMNGHEGYQQHDLSSGLPAAWMVRWFTVNGCVVYQQRKCL